ncbi:MAG: hypothetical protein LUF68_01345, partial [Clostridiales bacterium]|nr:hypothetical protein [Clostridiales bacterium]
LSAPHIKSSAALPYSTRRQSFFKWEPLKTMSAASDPTPHPKYPVLILKSRGAGIRGNNSRMVLFGSVKTQNGQPVMTVLDLRPNENGFLLIDMQKVNSAYTKKNPANFVADSEVMYADVKRTTPLLPQFGLTIASRQLLRSGSMGSITYQGNTVNLQGEKFSSVVEFSDSDDRFSTRLPVEETEKLVQENSGSAAAEETDSEGRALTAEQAEFFKDSKVRDEAGNLQVVYRGQNGNYTWFKPDYRGAIWATTYQPYAQNIGENVDNSSGRTTRTTRRNSSCATRPDTTGSARAR